MVANAVTVRKRSEDTRDWKEYNRWQTEEVILACQQLRLLVESASIHDWERRTGRPRVPRRSIVLCLLVKAYFNVSYRRAVGLLALLQPVLDLERVPHFNTLAKYNRLPGMTLTLESVFEETARPFWATERVISVDASGLLLQGSGAWRSNKREEDRRDFAKIHVLNGAKSRATLLVKTTRGTWHDAPQLPSLLDRIPGDASAEVITGDSAYWSHENCEAAKEAGLQPYFKPKSNARWWTHPKDAFEAMTRYARQFPNRFKRVYHRRSTSESRFSTEKTLFGDRLRCRRPVSRRNEVLAREIVHNVRLLTKQPPSRSN